MKSTEMSCHDLKPAILLDLSGDYAREKQTEKLNNCQYCSDQSQRKCMGFYEVTKGLNAADVVNCFLFSIASECVHRA